jgi:hypothetical protein
VNLKEKLLWWFRGLIPRTSKRRATVAKLHKDWMNDNKVVNDPVDVCEVVVSASGDRVAFSTKGKEYAVQIHEPLTDGQVRHYSLDYNDMVTIMPGTTAVLSIERARKFYGCLVINGGEELKGVA